MLRNINTGININPDHNLYEVSQNDQKKNNNNNENLNSNFSYNDYLNKNLNFDYNKKDHRELNKIDFQKKFVNDLIDYKNAYIYLLVGSR